MSKECYREVFTTKFNLLFGYPRTDTCSSCDKFEAEIKVLNLELSGNVSEEKKKELNYKIKQITTENQVNKLKATTFYTRKRMSRLASKKDVEKEAIVWTTKKTYHCLI